MRRGRVVLLALVLLGSYAYFYQGGGWNQNSRFDLTRALVERGSVRIDGYDDNTGDKAVFEGHAFSDKAPGQAFTAVPPVAVGTGIVRAIGGDPGGAAVATILSYAASVWAAALPTVLAALCLAWVARRLGASAGGATFAALAFGLATPAWAYATLFWGHALAAGSLAAAFAAAVGLRDGQKRGRRAALLGVVVGLAAGWAIVTEYPAAPAAVIVGLLALAHARRAVLWIGVGALVALAVLGVYDLAAFGSPLHVGYANVQGFSGMQEGILGVTAPKRTVLQEIVFGSFRGLLPLAPVIVLAPIGLASLWRDPSARPAVLAAAAIALYYLLFNASYFYWDGGFSYGPRHLGATLPFLCLGLAPLWTRAGRLIRSVLTLLAGYGVVLTGMAVSTTVLLPESVMSPIRELVWPSFARGELALNHDLYVLRPQGPAGVLQAGILERGAWNLGQLAGFDGHLSLLPLVVFWVAAAAAWVWLGTLSRGSPADPATSCAQCRKGSVTSLGYESTHQVHILCPSWTQSSPPPLSA